VGWQWGQPAAGDHIACGRGWHVFVSPEKEAMPNQTRESGLRSIGNYRVLECLATTDLTSVYKGFDPATRQPVAIKVASDATKNKPVLLRRFNQEFMMIKGLSHPNLVRALRFGYHGDFPYMALEYVDGQSLGDRIEREGPLPEVEVVHIIIQIGGALHYAHQQRVIHRDVKPDNILLTSDGVPKLADLGLAKDCDSEELLTRPSTGLGTPNFMAPEQFTDAKHADPRCDVYSLGATLYMAVTGEAPFRAKGPMSILKKKLDNDLVPPRKVVARISPRTESAILRAMSVNPLARHPSCRGFINDLMGRSTGGTPTVVSPSRAVARQATASKKDHERRAAARLAASKQAICQPLRAGHGGEWDATLHDISADGVALIIPRRFEPRTVLALTLPDSDAGPANRILVRVVRVNQRPGRCWLHGCVFANRIGDEEVVAMA
jgi:serine/threonine protein kinase